MNTQLNKTNNKSDLTLNAIALAMALPASAATVLTKDNGAAVGDNKIQSLPVSAVVCYLKMCS